MKWIALTVAIASLPWLIAQFRNNATYAKVAWIAVGALPFLLSSFHLDMSIIDWAGWPGHTKGLQISLLDIVAIALIASQPRVAQSLPFKLAMFLYFVVALLSVFQANMTMPAIFYCWQLARVFLVYAVVARGSIQNSNVEAILTGLTLGLCFQLGLGLWQRFALGMLQVEGSFGHQNSLGVTIHFVIFPMFALLLSGKTGWLPLAGTIVGMTLALLTTSRATVGFIGLGMVLLFVLASVRSWNQKKLQVLISGTILAAVAIPIAVSSFEARFAREVSVGDYDERAAFERAASLLLSDHPMGVGSNNYVVTANIGGYLERAGVAAVGGSRSTLVHNAYWVAAAETGYLGFISFLFLFASVTVAAFNCSWSNKTDRRADLLLGLGVTMLMVMMHNMYEWIIFYAPMQYLFAIDAGLIAGLAAQLNRERESESKSVVQEKPLMSL